MTQKKPELVLSTPISAEAYILDGMQFEIHLLDLEFEKFEKWANKDFFDRR